MAAKAKSQVELRREYVAEHPEEKQALKDLQATTRAVLESSQLATSSLGAGPTTAVGSESALAEYTVPDAVDLIAEMDDRAEVQSIIDNDTRKGVKAAAEKRLAELSE